MKFILPRLFGLALIAGIGAMLLTVIFKALLAISLVVTVAYFAAKRFGRRHGAAHAFRSMYEGRRRQMHASQGFDPFGNDIVPVAAMQHSSGIIPIN